MTTSQHRSSPAIVQLLADKLTRASWDVVIVGAGPAGTTAATLLARHGHQVLLIDRAHFPREKVCGDILLPDTMRSLERLGLYDRIASVAHPLGKLQGVSTGGTSFIVTGDYNSLKRSHFDLLLLEESCAAGAVFCTDQVIKITESAEHKVTINLHSGATINASLAIIATGADATLAQQTGVATGSQVNAVALRCYIHSDHQIEEGIFCYHREIAPGYAWIFPLGNCTYNVGCGVALSDHKQYHLKQMFETFVTEFEPARLLLENGGTRTHLIGAAIRFGLLHPNQSVSGRVVAIGETIGTTIPFTGEGIGTAMRSAELAADCVHCALSSGDPGELARYPDLLKEFIPLFAGYSAAQRWLRFPLFNDLAARRIKASSHMRQLCSGVIAGETDPREIYSVKGILKSFWK